MAYDIITCRTLSPSRPRLPELAVLTGFNAFPSRSHDDQIQRQAHDALAALIFDIDATLTHPIAAFAGPHGTEP